VTEEAYNALKRLKGMDESFSQTILKISAGKGNIGKFFGILPEKDVYEARKRAAKIRKELSEGVDKRVRS